MAFRAVPRFLGRVPTNYPTNNPTNNLTGVSPSPALTKCCTVFHSKSYSVNWYTAHVNKAANMNTARRGTTITRQSVNKTKANTAQNSMPPKINAAKIFFIPQSP